MKKIINSVFFFLSVIAIVAACLMFSYAYENESYYKGLEGTTINVFNWGEYISDSYDDGCLDVNKEFEKLTGIKVNYVTFESNEDMYAKIKNGGTSYDVIVPSDYMIARMAEEGMLEKFDVKNLPNYKYINPKYKGMYYDENEEYSVAYNVGMVGLIYNTKMVEGTPDSWSILWDKKYAGQILMIDNSRDAFAIPAKILGYSLNTTDEKELGDIAQMLIDQKPLLQSYVMDEIFNKMESGEAAMAPYYVGDYIIMKENNPDLAFVYPKEGVNIFADGFCIPKGAKNIEAAKLYINFMMDPEIALSNAWYIGYATPNMAVLEDEEYMEDLGSNEYLYPDDDMIPDNCEYFFNLPQDTLTMFAQLWNDIKVAGASNTHIYVGFGITFGLIAAFWIFKTVKNARRKRFYEN